MLTTHVVAVRGQEGGESNRQRGRNSPHGQPVPCSNPAELTRGGGNVRKLTEGS